MNLRAVLIVLIPSSPGVVAGVVAAIHVLLAKPRQNVNGRDERGRDAGEVVRSDRNLL